MRTRKTHRKQGGFALLIVVLVVALIGVAAVALLDIVNVDLLIVGQHRRTVDAKSNALGAMMEVVSDARVDGTVKPLPNTPGLNYQYAGKSAGVYMRDPAGRFAATQMLPSNSAYIKNVGTGLEEGYEADISLLRITPVEDSGLNRVIALTHEVRVLASVNNGDATNEVRAITTQLLTVEQGRLFPRVHAR